MKLIADETIDEGKIVCIGANLVRIYRGGEEKFRGVAKRKISKGEIVEYDPNGETEDISTNVTYTWPVN
jgi:hypothetical protein